MAGKSYYVDTGSARYPGQEKELWHSIQKSPRNYRGSFDPSLPRLAVLVSTQFSAPVVVVSCMCLQGPPVPGHVPVLDSVHVHVHLTGSAPGPVSDRASDSVSCVSLVYETLLQLLKMQPRSPFASLSSCGCRALQLL